ncbi:MAG: hypothetical protein HZB33_07395 [Nitrospirae bacterium]|nr:hypothetical protein [Nitrospirota bacterium]
MKKGFVRFFALSIVLLCAFAISEAADTALEKTFQKNLEDNHSVVKKAKEKQKKGEPADQEVTRLKAKSGEIKAAHSSLHEKFRQREEEVKSLGQLAIDRHRAMEEGYNRAMYEYLSLLDSLPPNGKATQKELDAIDACLEKILHKKNIPILGSLPYRNLNHPSKEPSQDPPIKPAYKGGNKTVSPDDLKSTEEAPISEEMATLAQSLKWNPVSIYEYVKNSISTEWYWGCMKGAEETRRQDRIPLASTRKKPDGNKRPCKNSGVLPKGGNTA